MLHFAAPLGLLALGAVLVPLLLHLVRRPRRVVRVGSLDFLAAERHRVKSLRWRDLLLLALRCALLAALALLLAGPQWETARPVRWMLLVPGVELDPAARLKRDQVVAEGFEARWLAPGFPPATTGTPGMEPGDAWSLLREADAGLPAGSRAVVLGPRWDAQFGGARPVLSRLEVTWQAVDTPPPSIAAPGEARVLILAAANRAEEARVLRAALEAVGGIVFTEREPRWIFALGDVELSADLTREVSVRGARWISDPPDTAAIQDVDRWFTAVGADVHVRRRVAPGEGAPLLADGAGDPIVVARREGAGQRWQFAVRFHPDWSDWTVGGAFPAWWRAQVRPPPIEPGMVSVQQAAPRFDAAARSWVLPSLAFIDLRPACWIAAVLFFAAERALGWRGRRTT